MPGEVKESSAMNTDLNSMRLAVRSGNSIPVGKLRNILVRGTNWIGDVIMTLPAFRSIRATCPEAHIAVLVKPWVAEIFRACPDVDEVILYQRPGTHAGLSGLLKLVQELRNRKFDCAILLQNAIEAAIIARLAGIPIRAGYNSDARGLLLTHSVQRTKAVRQVHQTRYYTAVLESLGFAPVGTDIHLRLGNEGEALWPQLAAKCRIENARLVIGMAPGAEYGPAKRWPVERFAEVAALLVKKFSAKVVLLGSRGDRGTAELIRKSAGEGVVNAAGETGLLEAMVLISKCALFLSNDSGLMHVAGALGVPAIAIFGSTNPVTTSPPGPDSLIIRKELPCSPCLKKECPTDFRCMTSIGADEVFEAARKILNGLPRK